MTPTAARSTGTSYDQVPYPNLSYAQTHPDRLATVATLLGMEPPPVTGCRVLELGCAGGGNLIPMAYGLPGSAFVGVDLAARQIAQGQEMIDALGLTNVTLRHMDILDVAPPPAADSLGRFDYVIAHGVYSWTPEAVRDKLLSVCRENLAPNGVAYVSYNTYPGWHMLNIVRDMMRYHTRDVEDPHARAAQARDLLDFLVQATAGTDGASGSVAMGAYASFIHMYAQFLSGELEGRRRPKIDALLLHDELETHNEPVYFHQFARHAAEHGLQYLAEAEFHSMVDSNFPPQVSERLCEMARDVVELEQYMDFLRNRSLRQTLLCHADVPFSRKIKPERLQRLYVASQAKPAPVVHGATNPPNGVGVVVKFEGSDGAAISTDHPITKAAMGYLYDIWPQAVPFDQVLAEARARLAEQGETSSATSNEHAENTDSLDAQILSANLLKAYSYSGALVRFHTYAPPLTLTVGERPQASPLARLQAQDSQIVTNLRHERVTLDAFNRYLLLRLDGQHDRETLLQAFLDGPVTNGVLKIQQEGQPVESPQEVRWLLAEALERNLHGLARTALLIE